MATSNNQGVYIEAHNDNHGTSHINIYGSGTIVESDGSGNKTSTNINLNK